MAVQPTIKPILTLSYTAAADLSAKRYHFVKFSADRVVNVCTAITDVPCGVLLNTPESGEIAEVMVIGLCPVSANAALAAGNHIGPSTDSQAQVAVSTQYNCGQMHAAAAGAGTEASAFINCSNQPLLA